jgi:hypothetical protein
MLLQPAYRLVDLLFLDQSAVANPLLQLHQIHFHFVLLLLPDRSIFLRAPFADAQHMRLYVRQPTLYVHLAATTVTTTHHRLKVLCFLKLFQPMVSFRLTRSHQITQSPLGDLIEVVIMGRPHPPKGLARFCENGSFG